MNILKRRDRQMKNAEKVFECNKEYQNRCYAKLDAYISQRLTSIIYR